MKRILAEGKLSAQKITEAINLRREQAMPFRKIAARINCAPETIRRILIKYEIKVIPQRGTTSTRPVNSPSPRAAIFEKLYPY